MSHDDDRWPANCGQAQKVCPRPPAPVFDADKDRALPDFSISLPTLPLGLLLPGVDTESSTLIAEIAWV